MDRKTFIKQCGFSCLAGTSMALLLQSCSVSKTLTGKISGDELVVPLAEFEIKNAVEKKFKGYVIVQHDQLKYPICVFRFNAHEYAAMLMRCTHQGTELQVFGDKLQCPAHGSEFDNKGIVTNGPADENLRLFPVKIDNTQLKISLRK